MTFRFREPKVAFSKAAFSRAFPGESDYVEFKSGFSSTVVQETAVSFSNSDGGILWIGVDDAGNLLGKELTGGISANIHQAFNSVRDSGRYQVVEVDVDDVKLVAVEVARRLQGFSQTADGRVLVRRGARNQPLFGDDLVTFMNKRSLERFDVSDSGISLSAASDSLIADIAATCGWDDPEAFRERLADHNLTVSTPEGVHLTVAGALFLLPDPSDVLGKAYVEVLRFPGESADYDKRTTFGGPIQGQVEVATDYVMDELGTEPVTIGVHRHELPRLPREVLREAISNGIAHRSYQLSGSSVRIELRHDAVRIVSPGPLPEPVTVQNIRETQAARNVEVIRLLRRYRLAEDAGRGVDVMQDAMQAQLLDPPEFSEDEHQVVVDLPVRGPVTPRERAWILELERQGEIEAGDKVILVHAARGEELTNARVRDLLGEDSADVRIRLQRLRDGGFLRQTGSRGGATYFLSDRLAPVDDVRVRPADHRALIMDIAHKAPVNNARVRAATGLDRVQALRLLEELVAEGKLVRSGAGRGTLYASPQKKWVVKVGKRG